MRWLVFFPYQNGFKEKQIQLFNFKPPSKTGEGTKIEYENIIEVDDYSTFEVLLSFYMLKELEHYGQYTLL